MSAIATGVRSGWIVILGFYSREWGRARSGDRSLGFSNKVMKYSNDKERLESLALDPIDKGEGKA